MGANQYLPFAVSGGANVLSYSAYNALTARLAGFVAGEAISQELNTVWRQGSMAAAVVGQLVADYSGQDALDDGSVSTLEANFITALSAIMGTAYYGADSSVSANTITATVVKAPPALAAGQEYKILIANTNTGAATLQITGFSAKNIKRADGSNVRPFDLQAGSIETFRYTGSLFQVIKQNIRTPLAGNLNLYVATTGSDSTNSGLTSLSPFATLQKAYDYVRDNLDLNGYSVTVNVADGSYSAGADAGGALIGAASGTANYVPVTFNGGSGAIITAASGHYCFSAFANANIGISGGIKVQGGSSGFPAVYAATGGTVLINGITFGACTEGHMYADSSASIRVTGAYSITGAAPYHMWAVNNGSIECSGLTITSTGTLNYSTAFAQASLSGIIRAQTNTYSGGTITGARYLVTSNSVIFVNGAGASYFPGDSAGSAATGGQYI